jgi:hypothetical protein
MAWGKAMQTPLSLTAVPKSDWRQMTYCQLGDRCVGRI